MSAPPMDPLYEQRLGDEVIYLHSLWHQGPPRFRTGASSASAFRSHPQPLETNHTKKGRKRKYKIGSNMTNKPNNAAQESNSSPGVEWPCPAPLPPSSSTQCSTWVENNNPGPLSLTPEDQCRLVVRRVHKQATKVVHEFLMSNSGDDPDEICSSSDEGDVLMEIADGREEYSFFLKVFEEDIELRQYYKKNFARGEFNCLVCGALGGKNECKKYKGCLALVQHSITISRTKKRRAHRALGLVVCKVLGWDIDHLHAIVSMLSANGETGGNANIENAETPGNTVDTAKVNNEKTAQESCSIDAENSLQVDDGNKGNSENMGTPHVNTAKTAEVNNEKGATNSGSIGAESLFKDDDGNMGNVNKETNGLPVDTVRVLQGNANIENAETPGNTVDTAKVNNEKAAQESCSIDAENSLQVDDGNKMMTTKTQNSYPLASVLEQNKLNGSNFVDWYRNLKIVLKYQKKDHVLDTPLPAPLADTVPRDERERYEKRVDEANEVSCLMLVSMAPDLQRRFEDWKAYDMICELKNMFQEQTRCERYRIRKELFECKMVEGASVSVHVQKLMGLIEQLGKLGSVIDKELCTDLILHSLPSSFSMFIMNYNMAGVIKPLDELHSLLCTAETSIRRTSDVLSVSRQSKQMKKDRYKVMKKAKDKGKATTGSKNKSKPKKISTPTPDTTCFHCNDKGHFKRECPKFLEEQKS